MPISEVYNEDCMLGMKRYPDKFFDLAIVDPPYGISVTKMNMGGRQTIKPDARTWDDDVPNDFYFKELFRVSKNQVIWGGNYFDLPVNRCFLIWDKAEGMYGRDFSECEYAWTSFNKPARIYKKGPNQLERIHPTQKLISLYQWVLRSYTTKGDKILDTHLGSQSSRIAAYKMGFDFYGWEIDKDYFDAGCKRFDQVVKQNPEQDLFGNDLKVIYKSQSFL